MISFLEKIPNIYKRFNETTTSSAIKFMQVILKRIIVKQKLNICKQDLLDIEAQMQSITLCEKGLVDEEHTIEHKNLFGKDAVNYLFWKLVNAANEDNTGCNPGQLYKFLEDHPAILIAALKGAFLDKNVINKHKQLEKDGKYMQDCYMDILRNLKKSLPET